MRTLLVALLALACATDPGAPPAAEERALAATESLAAEPAPLMVWAHDEKLEDAALKASARIAKASGLQVIVDAPETMDAAVPLFWSTAGTGDWKGVTRVHEEGADWIAITVGLEGAELEQTVLHETIHAIGSPHLEEGAEGVMAEHGSTDAITAADLELLCSTARCTTFAPEI